MGEQARTQRIVFNNEQVHIDLLDAEGVFWGFAA
jgi:hypothetical protein